MTEPPNTVFEESRISYYGWIVVGMAFLANLIAFGLVYSFGVFLKPLASEYGWTRSVTAGAFGFYGISHTLLAPFAGKLCDRFGPRLVLTIGGLFLGLPMILMVYTSTVWELYVCYGFLFSIGIAGVYVPVMSTVSQWFKAKRGFAMGLTAAGLGAGSFVFSPLSAWLITSFGWRKAYAIIGILSWVVFIPIVKFIKEVPREYKTCEELKGFSFSEALSTKTFWVFGLTWLLGSFTMWATMIHFVPMATDLGMSIMSAGILAGIMGATSIIGRISSGFLSDKVGRKRILITEFSLQLITFIWLFFSTKLWMIYLFAVFFGISSGGWAGVIAAFPADYFGFRATGSILGFANILAGVGMAIGPFMGGYVFDTTRSYDYMVFMCIMGTFGAIIFASLLKPPLKLLPSRQGQGQLT